MQLTLRKANLSSILLKLGRWDVWENMGKSGKIKNKSWKMLLKKWRSIAIKLFWKNGAQWLQLRKQVGTLFEKESGNYSTNLHNFSEKIGKITYLNFCKRIPTSKVQVNSTVKIWRKKYSKDLLSIQKYQNYRNICDKRGTSNSKNIAYHQLFKIIN